MDAKTPEPQFEDPQQAAFYRAIAERDAGLGGWYFGARVALANPANPEIFVHAGHSIRELMNNLHNIVDVPAKSVDSGRLSDVFNTMADRWDRGRKRSRCFTDGVWSGEIDDPARTSFAAVEEAITWHRENRPRRRETVRTTIRGLDASKRPVPSWIEDKKIDLWDELRDFFIAVCHHGRETDEVEFSGALDALERFVLDQLRPRTFDQQDALADLIRQAENG